MINSILVWSCRGTGARGTLRHIQEMIKRHKPPIVALLEPRVQNSSFASIFHSEIMTDMIAVETRGFAGGIWLMWNRHKLTVEDLSSNDQILNILVHEKRISPCLVSIVYASSNALTRADLWKYITQLGEIVHIPWAIMGDFNQPLESVEKHEGRPIIIANADKL